MFIHHNCFIPNLMFLLDHGNAPTGHDLRLTFLAYKVTHLVLLPVVPVTNQ